MGRKRVTGKKRDTRKTRFCEQLWYVHEVQFMLNERECVSRIQARMGYTGTHDAFMKKLRTYGASKELQDRLGHAWRLETTKGIENPAKESTRRRTA